MVDDFWMSTTDKYVINEFHTLTESNRKDESKRKVCFYKINPLGYSPRLKSL